MKKNINQEYGFEEEERYAEQGDGGEPEMPEGTIGEALAESVEWAIGYLRQYIEKTGKPQSAVAAELDISSGALSSFLGRKYKTPHTIVKKVKELAAISEKKKVTPQRPGFVETTISRRVMQAIQYSHLQGAISVVYGDAGIGKTEACRQYLKQNSLAIGITISPTYASITGVNELIAEKMGIRERVARRITSEIVTKLRGSGRVLIVDEAQHLTTRSLNHLRCISDESGAGICFVGNEEVYKRLKGSGKADFAQLFSRIGMHPHVLVNHISREDVGAIFGRMEVDSESQEILYSICRTLYGLRGAVNVYINTAALYGSITPAGLARVMKEMDIGGTAYGG